MSEKATKIQPAIDQIGKVHCTGCTACMATCRRAALTIVLGPEGFYYPQVDRARCNTCGACAHVCPVLIQQGGDLQRAVWQEPMAFAAWSCDDNVRLASSSGGVFTGLAQFVLNRGGVIVGCGWSSDWTPQHMLARSETGLAALRSSKYVQSFMGDILRETVRLCNEGVPVLFSGTPCQVAAVQQIISPTSRQYLISCEILCHGVTSVRVFQSYIHWLFDGEPIQEFSFRYKPLGWKTSHLYARSRNREYKSSWESDPWAQLSMGRHFSLMEACFHCAFQTKHRLGDVTLGDFWGIPESLYDSRGVSIILVNSPLGEELCFSAAEKGNIKIVPVEWHTAAEQNARVAGADWPAPRQRRIFLHDVSLGHSFRYLYWRYYVPFYLKTRTNYFVVSALRRVLPSSIKSALKQLWHKSGSNHLG